ncbi:DUF938 domain-containing protein [Alteromonas oceanisediminis]|uniref:DUF938 domain-containing protein n=1 Tax=Alteromonas oceanisediminis TaxID=2836180 RepID=UPI001BDA9BC7|nr:DUF938 domain-containing protein [Alteromonas oceanisediminis]MBT0584890.1 DUF938 domain-containing protein [Alteromonas oceanisediminis]
MTKPFSQACENNKQFIADVLQSEFNAATRVLEIGSGTGQHAVHLAKHLPHLAWQTSDQPQYHQGINLWIDEYPWPNLKRPIAFQVGKDDWPKGQFDAVFSANTAHIMQRSEVQLMMQLIQQHLPANGVFCQYGPFTENGKFNSQSNADFHRHLVAEGYGGYRDITELQQWGKLLTLIDRITMPANNLLLIWKKQKTQE